MGLRETMKKWIRYARPCARALEALEQNAQATQRMQESAERFEQTVTMYVKHNQKRNGKSEPVTEP